MTCQLLGIQSSCGMQAVYDAKSEEIGPGIYRFKAEIGIELPLFAAFCETTTRTITALKVVLYHQTGCGRVYFF